MTQDAVRQLRNLASFAADVIELAFLAVVFVPFFLLVNAWVALTEE